MAERRAVRRTRQQRDDEPVEEAGDELTDEADEEPDDELAEEPDDESAEDPDDELAEVPDDELAEEPDDEEAEQSSRASRDGDRRSRRRSGPGGGGIKPAKAGQLAMRQIAELTGKQPEGVTGVEPGDDGWIVGVEVVEDRRVPSSSDILATYETEVDSDGELVSYHRVKRYLRGRGDSED